MTDVPSPRHWTPTSLCHSSDRPSHQAEVHPNPGSASGPRRAWVIRLADERAHFPDIEFEDPLPRENCAQMLIRDSATQEVARGTFEAMLELATLRRVDVLFVWSADDGDYVLCGSR